uniref:Uncharacterized protein n=1 Tax=Sander lucioperca TaxID=283035 RepID=A0A8D0CVX7_SANLU
MPVDWKQSRTCSLHSPTFNLEEKPVKTDVTAELSDDEELREQLDMHSIIVSCLTEEPLFTAEQVSDMLTSTSGVVNPRCSQTVSSL